MSRHAQALIDYIHGSPSPYHCVAQTAAALKGAGFSEVSAADEWPTMNIGAGHFLRRNGTLIAWRNGEKAPAVAGFRMVGAHTDSPNLRLKPQADYQKEGYAQWGVQVYGGVLIYTWFDRDLGLSGRVFTRGDDGPVERLIRIDEPIARVSSLAIHLNRKIREDGFKPNSQTELPPLVGLTDEDAKGALETLLCEQLEVEFEDVLGHDLMLHDVQPPTLGGVNGEFIFAPRLDNQGSCYTALQGLLAADVGAPTALIPLFDHEECGSRSAHGGDGALIEHVMRRIIENHAQKESGGLERAAASSFMISADMSHGVHPNYADRHEGHHKPRLGGGPVIKTHANQRYATDGETAARFRTACQSVGVPVQDFVVRTDLACGSTIGPITSTNLAIRTVDVGCAMLSMHSIREQAAAADVEGMIRVKAHLLSGRA